MIALVTGSNGFLGSHLVEGLLARGYEVHCLVRRTSDLTWLRHLPVRLLYGDVTSESGLVEAVSNKDHVYHAAGLVRATSQRAFDRVNFHGTARLLRACCRHNAKLKRFVLISSQSAGGPASDRTPVTEEDEARPVSLYGKSKWKAEREAMRYMGRLPVTIIRPPAIFGPRDRGMYPAFKMVHNGIVVLPRGERYASLVYVKDVVAGTILAAEKDRAVGQTYYIAGERGHTWRQFAVTAGRVMGRRPRIVSVPQGAVRALGALNTLASIVTRRPAMLNWQKANEVLHPYWLCDISKARRELGYAPAHSLEDGLAETVEWYRSEGWL